MPINPEDWLVNIYKTEDPNVFGFNLHNPDGQHVDIRGFVPIEEGQTFLIDGIGLFAYIPVDESTLGGHMEFTDMPGSEIGVIDNIYELDSAQTGGSSFFKLRDNIGTIVTGFDTQYPYFPNQPGNIENSINKWNRIPDGYSFDTPLSEFFMFDGSQETFEECVPGQLKYWTDRMIENVTYNGYIDIPNATVYYSKNGAGLDTFDEEEMSKHLANPISPFANEEIEIVPDAYIHLARTQVFSDIYSEIFNGGSYMPFQPIDFLGSFENGGFGMRVANSDDGSMTLPNGIPPLEDLITTVSLDMNGYAEVTISDSASSAEMVSAPQLHQNHPNPFNPSTTISFTLPSASPVSLKIYDVSGKVVRDLVSGQTMEEGTQQVMWDGRDDDGQVVSAGVYFYKLSAGDFSETKRMVLVK